MLKKGQEKISMKNTLPKPVASPNESNTLQ